ncbi:MAG: hypothetical protein G01um101425_536 [Candidatus Peregrinibacteria bacterium Gr01-1014_25]|nr:MAG: hypothetical protein G01um101425_536 [Candidatus Peregrinibacteria bacterium Gr01-1014_25]
MNTAKKHRRALALFGVAVAGFLALAYQTHTVTIEAAEQTAALLESTTRQAWVRNMMHPSRRTVSKTAKRERMERQLERVRESEKEVKENRVR